MCLKTYAGVAKLADAPDLGSGVPDVRVRVSSSALSPVSADHWICGSSSVGRAPPCQGGGRESEPRLPLQFRRCNSMVEFQPSKLATWVRFPSPAPYAPLAQLVEHLTLNQGAQGSSP